MGHLPLPRTATWSPPPPCCGPHHTGSSLLGPVQMPTPSLVQWPRGLGPPGLQFPRSWSPLPQLEDLLCALPAAGAGPFVGCQGHGSPRMEVQRGSPAQDPPKPWCPSLGRPYTGGCEGAPQPAVLFKLLTPSPGSLIMGPPWESQA